MVLPSQGFVIPGSVGVVIERARGWPPGRARLMALNGGTLGMA
jgi:hypothetical protein